MCKNVSIFLTNIRLNIRFRIIALIRWQVVQFFFPLSRRWQWDQWRRRILISHALPKMNQMNFMLNISVPKVGKQKSFQYGSVRNQQRWILAQQWQIFHERPNHNLILIFLKKKKYKNELLTSESESADNRGFTGTVFSSKMPAVCSQYSSSELRPNSAPYASCTHDQVSFILRGCKLSRLKIDNDKVMIII